LSKGAGVEGADEENAGVGVDGGVEEGIDIGVGVSVGSREILLLLDAGVCASWGVQVGMFKFVRSSWVFRCVRLVNSWFPFFDGASPPRQGDPLPQV
jgi:hypothetical protein